MSQQRSKSTASLATSLKVEWEVLIISSELPEILGMSDRVVVMREGLVAGEFNTAQASEESLLACAAGVVQ